MKILIASGNQGKIREFHEILKDFSVDTVSLKDLSIKSDVKETGSTFLENAKIKATEYSNISNLPALADDSGLEVEALGNEPGVKSARYAGDDGNAQKNIRKLLKKMDGKKNRKARFVCQLVLALENDILLKTSGTVDGVITCAPLGNSGFGYDPVFYVPEENKTMAQLPPERKNAISHRGEALRQFKKHFPKIIDKLKHFSG